MQHGLMYDCSEPFVHLYAFSPSLFTGKERDAESGNDYAMARYYASRLARFSSPDPVSGSVFEPQTLNRYSYAENDPINGADPSGLKRPAAIPVGGGGPVLRYFYGGFGGGGIDGGCTLGGLDFPCDEIGPIVESGGSASPPTDPGGANNPAITINLAAFTSAFIFGEPLNFGVQDEFDFLIAEQTFGENGDYHFDSWVRAGALQILSSPASNDINDAIRAAKDFVRAILEDPNNDCSQFFNDSPMISVFDPGDTAANYFNSDHILPNNQQDYPMAPETGAGSTQAAGWGAVIAVNPLPNGAFLADTWWLDSGHQFRTGTLPGQALELLHELGHTLGAIPEDGGSTAQSNANTDTIVSHCANAINNVWASVFGYGVL